MFICCAVCLSSLCVGRLKAAEDMVLAAGGCVLRLGKHDAEYVT
jgi:hypothetical protein